RDQTHGRQSDPAFPFHTKLLVMTRRCGEGATLQQNFELFRFIAILKRTRFEEALLASRTRSAR
ncbi:MAG TPA: hypothetical protein VNT25_05480, partial [Allosphingosinicella sp.]|nr:hypothetical protein [Allosphingosinicella sp.]